MRAKLAALVRVKAALEQRPHNGRVDLAPVQAGGVEHVRDLGRGGGTRVLAADLLGAGRPGLAWSDVAHAEDGTGYRYLRLDAAAKPYLMTAIDNGMERAYNFENDTELQGDQERLRPRGRERSGGRRHDACSAATACCSDIESFTYHAITTKTRKSSRIKDVVSLSALFPAQFEEFRRTGLLSFETDLYEFDRLHPGFFGQRIEAVELEIVGVAARDGPQRHAHRGRRQPRSAGATARRQSASHQVDTMALSDFVLREDVFLYGAPTGVRGLFQGLGLGTTWQLHLPQAQQRLRLPPHLRRGPLRLLHGEVRPGAAHHSPRRARRAGRADAAADLRAGCSALVTVRVARTRPAGRQVFARP